MRWKLILLIPVSLGLASCSQTNKEFIDACEQAIKRDLKAPTSYKRVSINDVSKDESFSAGITYSAANSYRQMNEYFVSCTFEGSYPSFYSVKLDGKSQSDKTDEFLDKSNRFLCERYRELGNSEKIAEYCN